VSRRILAIVLGLVALAGCTGSDGAGGGGPVSPSPADGTTTGPTGETSAPASLSPSPEPDRLLPEEGQFVALPLDRYTPMWGEPGRGRQPDFAFDTQNPFEQLAPMLIEGATRRDGEAWYEVLLPVRPNGETAWVRGADIRIRERTERIEVDPHAGCSGTTTATSSSIDSASASEPSSIRRGRAASTCG
jgi:hypothetical protein